jgi:hypothetical protein
MSRGVDIARLCGIALLAACGKHPAPDPGADLTRHQACPRAIAHGDSGIGLGQDVRRGPRYRVDSAGRVVTLPPIPAPGPDSARPGCVSSDASRGEGQR